MLKFDLTKLKNRCVYCVADKHILEVLKKSFEEDEAMQIFQKIDTLMFGSTVPVLQEATRSQAAQTGIYPHDLVFILQSVGINDFCFLVEGKEIDVNPNISGINP
ncbi:hypothetical protein [Vibrio campbellii]|uniref:hypothetical protein n=1 Tax=Vibrio campbellii TaxID=680 RepID=UPI0038CD8744